MAVGWLARVFAGLLLIGVLPFVAYAAAILLSGPLLGLPEAARKADVIVVLGGDGPARADHAAMLWRAGAAPRVLVTGRSDCGMVAERLTAEGVRPGAITRECRSETTWQNADFSAPLLARMGVHDALLVTSWFHARRALASFATRCPDLKFAVAPVAAPPFLEIATGPYGPAVLREYPKTVVYALRRWLAGFEVGAARAASKRDAQWTRC